MFSISLCFSVLASVAFTYAAVRTNAEVKSCMTAAAASNTCLNSCKKTLGTKAGVTNTLSAIQSCLDNQNKSLSKCTSRKGGLLNDSLPCLKIDLNNNDNNESAIINTHGAFKFHNLTGFANLTDLLHGNHSNSTSPDVPSGWNGEMSEPLKCLTECRTAAFTKCFDGCTGTPRKLGSKTQYNPIEGCQNKEALKVCIGRALVRKDSKKGQ